MPEIQHREYEGGIPGAWKSTYVTPKMQAAIDRAFDEYNTTCPICGAPIDDGEQGCPTPEEH